MIRYQMTKKEEEKPLNGEQLNLRPDGKLLSRLNETAMIFRGDKKFRTQISLEVLGDYLELWEDAERVRINRVSEQKERERAAIHAEEPYIPPGRRSAKPVAMPMSAQESLKDQAEEEQKRQQK
jgi:hypothetical protein